MSLKADDAMVGAAYSDGDSEVVVISETGNVLRYHEGGVPIVGLKSGGVKAVNDVTKTAICFCWTNLVSVIEVTNSDVK